MHNFIEQIWCIVTERIYVKINWFSAACSPALSQILSSKEKSKRNQHCISCIKARMTFMPFLEAFIDVNPSKTRKNAWHNHSFMHLSFFRLLNFFIPAPAVAFFRQEETFIGVVVYAPHIQFTIISTTLQADVVIYRHLGLRMCSNYSHVGSLPHFWNLQSILNNKRLRWLMDNYFTQNKIV